jgi:hypothetical protein
LTEDCWVEVQLGISWEVVNDPQPASERWEKQCPRVVLYVRIDILCGTSSSALKPVGRKYGREESEKSLSDPAKRLYPEKNSLFPVVEPVAV